MNAMAPDAIAFSSSANDLISQRIYTDRVRLLYAQAPLGVVGSLFVAPLLAFILWNTVPHSILVIWVLFLETTVAIRWALTVAFQRRAAGAEAIERWAERYTWACAASGVGWGGCVVLLALSPSLVEQSFIMLILGGVLMGGVLAMTPVLATCMAYALPLALPSVSWLLLQDDLLRIVMGTTGLLYLLLALGTAHRYHRTLGQYLRLALENLDLAQSCAKAQEQTERTNRRLAEQQAVLQSSVDALREFYRIISTPRRHANSQIQALLAMGCQRFGADTGVLARVEGEGYEIVQLVAPDKQLAPGDRFALDDTCCQETLRARQPVAFEPAFTRFQDRRQPQHFKRQVATYLGAAVQVGDRAFGTLSFSDLRSRPAPFTPVDLELIQLMAQWVGTTLEQDRMTVAAQRQHTLLAHASRLNTLGEMASGLAHEINQPITAIALYTETCLARLRSAQANPNEIRETLEKIAAQSARTNTIIQQVRHFARQSKPQYLSVRIEDLFDDIADFLRLEVHRHRIQFHQNIDAELPLVLADPLQFQQVVLNLIRNAVDAVNQSEGPRIITVFARLAEEVVEIGVKDTGPGVAPDIFNQLLNPFFTTKPDGLGLGLSISQSIVEAHGGRLWATSNQGPGLTLHFTLPVASRAKASERIAADLSLAAN
ncbi:MAG: GAF domain-containing protein [Candidatus Competibacteraceae bacterium]|nr:GAF domain-containing protein [Candidatus Competibacteraceae bacterium]